MPFSFSYVCDLLQRLEDNRLARSGLRSNTVIIQEWFRGHHGFLHRDDHKSAPLLSALLPEKRTDRVYFIREKKLQAIIGRALGLGRSRIAELGRWTNPEAAIDKFQPNPISPTDRSVTVEEIDGLLHSIAAACRFSSPSVRSSAENGPADQELSLGELYRRLSARDAKWLTRLLLKNYEPVVLDQRVVCAGYHPLLPTILKVQDDLAVAGRILDTLKLDRTVTGKSELAEYLKPTLGVKIGRQMWMKGRSIKHCLSMVQGRVSCEEKMDGEYCQIHIDLSKGRDCIQIFSKSGKDSTRDRMALHDDKHHKVLGFHKIRKHVSRSGSFLGTDKDSQAHPWEHLMIVYYDLLMVDNESLLAVKHSERFQRLKNVITQVPGRSSLVKREFIDCGRPSAVSDLRRVFAKCITARGEGLVLKADDPYFDFNTRWQPYHCCPIKLKKEYIGHFGDIGDFAVVGARFDAAKARTYSIPGLKWTHFYVGCLENKDEVQRFGKQPVFVVTNVVELNAKQLAAFVSSVNPESIRPEENRAISLRIEPGVDCGKRPSFIFPTPPVFDLCCFSFDKEGNTGFWSPRFPTVSKIHCDRTYHDTISFEELQEMAANERKSPPPEDSQELLGWIAALENSESRRTGDTASQATISTVAESVAQSPQPPNPGNQQCLAAQNITTEEMADFTRQSQSAHVAVAAEQHPRAEQDPALLQRPGSLRGPSAGQRRGGSLGEPAGALPGHPNEPVAPRCRSGATHAAAVTACRGGRAFELRPAHQANTGSRREEPPPSLQASLSFHEARLQSFAARSLATLAGSGPAGAQEAGPQPSEQPADQPNQPAQPDQSTDQAVNNATVETASARCQFLPDTCKFPTYSILVSPCVAGFPWVTDNLLGSHGVSEFLRDPKEWLDTQPGGTSTPAPSGTGSSGGPRRREKIIIVDRRRKKATVDFLLSVEAAGLKRRNGEREYVPAYDWRVLEEIYVEEKKLHANGQAPGYQFDLNHASSIWRKFWVGLA
ncbi:hypothetical protein CHGG_02472 [Chaetomium globosum CBS 148.51]|uniref:ATP-dependent DNA ligase family profile domain-containing protein n=1 Tax=Chaetomium globosum (strain ATCC 6205 / CBS 148.51 / DSM 1962 / NBRC 6347 / NRRL 1970) TaxID=306901 RepID=Q2HBD2_CHAGB|nr:uncharacterized protein CHGG_02472 [Chaetomium globosum CBS 148.51]EAQ90537.1 hypothetical protein CHGG_02472 [Chaetomium globosum CBS 148.51]